MVISGISIACFASFSTSSFPLIHMCAGTLHRIIFSPANEALLVCHISDIILDNFLYCSRWRALNSASLYILPILCLLSSIAVISAVWMDASAGSAPLLVMCANTAAKPTFLPVLFDPSL